MLAPAGEYDGTIRAGRFCDFVAINRFLKLIIRAALRDVI